MQFVLKNQQQQQDDCKQHPESPLSEVSRFPLLPPSPKVENCFPMFSESQLTHFMVSSESSTRTSNSFPQSQHSYSYKGIFTSTLVFNVTNIKNIRLESINYGRAELYTYLPRTCLILTLGFTRHCYNEEGQYNLFGSGNGKGE